MDIAINQNDPSQSIQIPVQTKNYDPIKYATPTGNTLTCKGWVQEAALRMLLNNLNPEVAERPEDLIVYGGRGKVDFAVQIFLQKLRGAGEIEFKTLLDHTRS